VKKPSKRLVTIVVVVALIVVAGIFFINRPRPEIASQPMPGDTYIPPLPSQEPPGQEPPGQEPLPNQGGQFPQPSDGVVTLDTRIVERSHMKPPRRLRISHAPAPLREA